MSMSTHHDGQDADPKKDKPRKKVKNVFTYMESTYNSQSPKSLLYRSIKDNQRIKVWTRSHSYVRSICTGYLVAFDQFWNLAMVDVDEVYKIPSSCLKENQQPAEGEESVACPGRLCPEINLYKSGNFQVFERHVSQLLIRGDNVVTVALADN